MQIMQISGGNDQVQPIKTQKIEMKLREEERLTLQVTQVINHQSRAWCPPSLMQQATALPTVSTPETPRALVARAVNLANTTM